ncbi:MAG TPA: peptidase M3, partial [Candidatus Limisoma intestinavium]|nr:peptidase M3 [Candidatus Limisoma intestinavium]
MTNAENIFFEEFKTTHHVVPFDRIEKSFYEEAVDSGIKQAEKEIDAIVRQRSTPTFENTIVALENSGELLNRTLMTFYPILSADGDDEMNEISLRIAPKLS